MLFAPDALILNTDVTCLSEFEAQSEELVGCLGRFQDWRSLKSRRRRGRWRLVRVSRKVEKTILLGFTMLC